MYKHIPINFSKFIVKLNFLMLVQKRSTFFATQKLLRAKSKILPSNWIYYIDGILPETKENLLESY